MEYELCASCATAVANDDTTHLTPEEAADFLGFMEKTGWLTMGDNIDGSVNCDCCGCYAYADGVRFYD